MENTTIRSRLTLARLIALFLSSLLLISCDSAPVRNSTASVLPVSTQVSSDNLIQQQIAAHFASLVQPDGPGFAYLVIRGETMLSSGATGWANIAEQKPNNLNTKFHIGSITKSFTAVAVLQLVEQEKLSLDDPLSRYFKGFPNGDQILLRHLLTHTSGIVDAKPEEAPFKLDEPYPMNDHVDWMKTRKLAFEPGEQWGYGNSAYVLLGLVVERVSGQTLQDYMEEHIFEPLDMQDTVLYDNATAYRNAAVGYSLVDGSYVPALDMYSGNWPGAGAGQSTVGDLHKWNVGLNTGKLLSPAYYRQAITPVQFDDDYKPFVPYGFGLAIEEMAGVTTVGHLGHQFGYHADVIWAPEEKISYVMLSNANQYELIDKHRAAHAVLDIVLNQEHQTH